MEIRKVNMSRGWDWFASGMQLPFQRIDAGIYFLAASFLLWKGIFIIPHAGYLLATFLVPLFVGAMGISCRDIQNDGVFSFEKLASGLSPFTPQLLRISFINVACLIITAAGISIVSHNPRLAMVTLGEWNFYSQVMNSEMPSQTLIALGLSFTVIWLLFFASWYSPLLVVFNNMKAADAMMTSLKVSLRNLSPFLLYGTILAVSWLLFAIAMYLLPFIILVPFGASHWLLPTTRFLSELYWPVAALVTYASVYASHADVFMPQPE